MPPMCGNFGARLRRRSATATTTAPIDDGSAERARRPARRSSAKGTSARSRAPTARSTASACGTCGDGVVDDKLEACEPGAPVPCSEHRCRTNRSERPPAPTTCTLEPPRRVVAPSADVIVSELMIVPLAGAELRRQRVDRDPQPRSSRPRSIWMAARSRARPGVQSFVVEGALVIEPLGLRDLRPRLRRRARLCPPTTRSRRDSDLANDERLGPVSSATGRCSTRWSTAAT